MLLGVEAPAVRPTVSGPDAGSQSELHRFRRLRRRRRADRPVPDLRRPRPGSPDRRCERSARAPRRCAPGCRCCCCCSRRRRASGRAARSSSSATTASCRSCVALQIVSNARKCAASVGVAVALAHRRRGTSRRSPATPTSASSSGWRSRCARRSTSGSKPGDAASPKRARNAARIAAVADVVADDRRLRARSRTTR